MRQRIVIKMRGRKPHTMGLARRPFGKPYEFETFEAAATFQKNWLDGRGRIAERSLLTDDEKLKSRSKRRAELKRLYPDPDDYADRENWGI